MPNKLLHQLLCVGFITLTTSMAYGQEADAFLMPTEPAAQTAQNTTQKPATPAAEIRNQTSPQATAPVVSNKEPIDFPARTSLDTLELAPLPGLFDTNISGPVPMAPSVSDKDMPSERLLGRLTPEVFQEMAELERDNTFLKLQMQKESMKNDLEKLRANYRQARLDEIAKREDLVRTRIQWWQEQEKIRQELENQRMMAENRKAIQQEQAEMQNIEEEIPQEIEEAVQQDDIQNKYAIVGIRGTRNALQAQIRNTQTEKVITLSEGESLADNTIIEQITPSKVVLIHKGSEVTLNFDE